MPGFDLIRDWSLVEKYYGEDIDLGDAELRSFTARSDEIVLQIWWLRTWFDTKYYQEGTINIVAKRPRSASLWGWAPQNVVDELSVEKVSSGAVRLLIQPTAGATLELEADALVSFVDEIERPFRPGWSRRTTR